jgi:hypothetical protein
VDRGGKHQSRRENRKEKVYYVYKLPLVTLFLLLYGDKLTIEKTQKVHVQEKRA